MYVNKTLKVVSTALAAILLTACSGGPSQSDIEASMKANFEQAGQAAKSLGGRFVTDDMLPKLYSVKKLDCAETKTASGYTCDLEVDASLPLTGRTKTVMQVRFVKGSDGWVAVD